MKLATLASLILALSLPGAAQADDDALDPKDRTEAGSYAFGYDLGKTFRERGVSVDLEQLVRGLREGSEGQAAPLNDKDLQKALAQFQGELRVKQEKSRRRAAVQGRAAGAAFLAENKARPGVTTLPSGLQYEIVKAGQGPTATARDTVVVDYRGTLVDGTEFDSTQAKGQPATLPVATLIPGWREALSLMPAGSRWRLVVPPELAYGERGAGKAVGPNATLVFDLELLAVR